MPRQSEHLSTDQAASLAQAIIALIDAELPISNLEGDPRLIHSKSCRGCEGTVQATLQSIFDQEKPKKNRSRTKH